MIFHKIKTTFLVTILLSGLFLSGFQPAQAQSAEGGLMPAAGSTVSVESDLSTDDMTHPPLRLTPDKSEIVEVDGEVDSVIIGNEAHINLFLDSKTRLVIVPRLPGATHFALLDKDGKVLMQRHVIVASPKQKYVRIREACVSTGCQPLRMFYCPDMCHEIGIVGSGGSVFSGSIVEEEDDDEDEDDEDEDEDSGE